MGKERRAGSRSPAPPAQAQDAAGGRLACPAATGAGGPPAGAAPPAQDAGAGRRRSSTAGAGRRRRAPAAAQQPRAPATPPRARGADAPRAPVTPPRARDVDDLWGNYRPTTVYEGQGRTGAFLDQRRFENEHEGPPPPPPPPPAATPLAGGQPPAPPTRAPPGPSQPDLERRVAKATPLQDLVGRGFYIDTSGQVVRADGVRVDALGRRTQPRGVPGRAAQERWRERWRHIKGCGKGRGPPATGGSPAPRGGPPTGARQVGGSSGSGQHW